MAILEKVPSVTTIRRSGQNDRFLIALYASYACFWPRVRLGNPATLPFGTSMR